VRYFEDNFIVEKEYYLIPANFSRDQLRTSIYAAFDGINRYTQILSLRNKNIVAIYDYMLVLPVLIGEV